jgi:hypothetical protein
VIAVRKVEAPSPNLCEGVPAGSRSAHDADPEQRTAIVRDDENDLARIPANALAADQVQPAKRSDVAGECGPGNLHIARAFAEIDRSASLIDDTQNARASHRVVRQPKFRPHAIDEHADKI